MAYITSLLSEAYHNSKRINYGLLLVLIVMSALPLTYGLLAINGPNIHHYDLHFNLVGLSVLFEIFTEALLFPMFHIFGQTFHNEKETSGKLRSGLLFISGLFLILTILSILFLPVALEFFSPVEHTTELSETIRFMELQIIVLGLTAIIKYVLIFLQMSGKKTYLIEYFLIQVVVTFILNQWLLNETNVLSVGYINLLVSLALLAFSIGIINRHFGGSFWTWPQKADFQWFRQWWHLGEHAFIDAIINNVTRILFISAIIGSEQFSAVDKFFSLIVLLPITQLGVVIKVDIGLDPHDFKAKHRGYQFVSTALLILLILGSFFWHDIFSLFGLAEHFDTSILNEGEHLFALFAITYILKAIQNLPDSFFYGAGELGYLTKQAWWTLALIYGPSFLVWKIFRLNLTSVHFLYVVGAAMVVDTVITFYHFQQMVHAEETGTLGISHH